MSDGLPVDAIALREEVKSKYRAVAVDPHGGYHFHIGRPLARRLGYDWAVVAALPDSAVEAFAGVGNPFSLGVLWPGERIIDLGSGGGFDCFIAAGQVGSEGHVVGVDMTEEMLDRSRAAAAATDLRNVEFRKARSRICRLSRGGPTLRSATALSICAPTSAKSLRRLCAC